MTSRLCAAALGFVVFAVAQERSPAAADDTAAIRQAIERSPEGSQVDFAEGRTYIISGTIELLPNRIYSGAATFRMAEHAAPGTPMFRLRYGRSHSVTLDGLTFDARGKGAILQLAVTGGTGIPARDIHVRNCSFLNSGTGGQVSDSAIYTPVGLRSSTIANNRFVNCGTCIHLTNPDHVTITGNEFDTTLGGNAISVVAYSVPFASGDALEITRNRGRNLKRMGIEIIGGERDIPLNSPLIAENRFIDWNASPSKDAFGISVAAGTRARILENHLSGGTGGYGIEVGAPGSVVTGNVVSGFYYGIVIQGQPDVTIESNKLNDQHEAAILFSNAAANPRARVVGNAIANARSFGIGMDPNDYRGTLIAKNTIEREGGRFVQDRTGTSFIGIKIDAGLTGPVTVASNRIVQTAPQPPEKFAFAGIGFFGGFPGSVYSDTLIESRSKLPGGTGLQFWYAPYADESVVSQNRFVNLAQITNGFTSKRVRASGNTSTRVVRNDPNIVSRSAPK